MIYGPTGPEDASVMRITDIFDQKRFSEYHLPPLSNAFFFDPKSRHL
jgi:hypothetical protein